MITFLKKRWLLFVLILISAGIGYFGYQKVYAKTDYSKRTKTVVKRQTLEERLTISGAIDAEEKVALRFQTSGRLVWVGVKEGDRVKKYQGIASLDKREVEKTLKKKLLAYMNERWDFEQTHDDKSVFGRELYKVPGLTDAERRILDKAQFDLDSTVLDVEIQNLAIEYANLWTPIAGIVTKVGAAFSGMNITPSTAEYEIINPDTIYFSATADQSEVVKLKEGDTGELVLDSFPDKKIYGTVSSISFTPKAGESNTVYTVKFQFTDDFSSFKYRIGMGGDVSFVLNKKENALTLPLKLIKKENGKKYVVVSKNGKDEKVFITTGFESDDSSEITSGLTLGETVYN